VGGHLDALERRTRIIGSTCGLAPAHNIIRAYRQRHDIRRLVWLDARRAILDDVPEVEQLASSHMLERLQAPFGGQQIPGAARVVSAKCRRREARVIVYAS
jgi:hypothetical protein